MRVLITGNKGFIGKYVEKKISEGNFKIEIEGYDLKDKFNLLDYDVLIRKMKNCDVVIHLAAIKAKSPIETMATNLQGTWNVLCAAKENNVTKIIFISSVDALGIFQGEGIPRYLPIDDGYPCHPVTPYSISKKLAEDMCQYFSNSSGIPVVCIRPPGVWDKNTYDSISIARKKRPEYEWEPYWEYGAFIDVRDLAQVIYLALITEIKGYNCFLTASDDITTSGLTSLELVHKLYPKIDWRGGIEYKLKPFKSLIQTETIKKVLGWSPQYSWMYYK